MMNKRFSILVAMVALAVGLGRPGAGQDGSLVLRITLESDRVWKSEFEGLAVLVEFKNGLRQQLRWHPRLSLFSPFSYHTALCFERADDKRYVHYFSPCTGGDEVTRVLPSGGSEFGAWEMGRVVEADGEWEPVMKGYGSQDFAYEGTLPLGAYRVWLRYYDGPVENGSFPERTPSPGVYTSNVATLIVVSDDTPGVLRPAAFEPADDPRRAPRVISHGGVDFAWAHDLARFGVAAKVDDRMRELALTRGKRRLILPITGDVVVANARAPVAAIPTSIPRSGLCIS